MNSEGRKSAVACAVLLALLLLPPYLSAAPAMPAIALEQAREMPNGTYPYEVLPYAITIVSPATESIAGLQMRVFVDEGLALVVDGRELMEQTFSIPLLEAGQSEKKEIFVKALRPSAKELRIGVDYGFEKYTHSISTLLSVKQNPIRINARLSTLSIAPDQQGSVLLDIANDGQAAIRNISAELIVPPDLNLLAQKFELALLEPAQSFANKEFRFAPREGAEGKKVVVLRIAYEDEQGLRVFERDFTVEIQQKFQYVVLIILIVIGVVVVSYVLGKQKLAKKPENVATKEITPRAAKSQEKKESA